MTEHSTPIPRTEEEWERLLTPEQFYVMRQKGTERAFTGKFLKHDEAGTYVCGGCGHPLFASSTKFDSGSGWPSFTDVVDKGNVILKEDTSHGMRRTEVLCKHCNAHLGHVFPDGPGPNGLRYCINSASLDFKKE